jgi:hypothetical protein
MNESEARHFPMWIPVLAVLIVYFGGYILYRCSGAANFYDPSEDVSGAGRPGLRISVTTPSDRFFEWIFRPCLTAEDRYRQRR